MLELAWGVGWQSFSWPRCVGAFVCMCLLLMNANREFRKNLGLGQSLVPYKNGWYKGLDLGRGLGQPRSN